MLDFLGLGLLAALAWGTGDFLTARSARKTNTENGWICSYGILALLWMVFGLASGSYRALSPLDFALAFAVALLISVGDFLFISAAKTGKIAVASPLFSLSAVVAMALGLAVLGETPDVWHIVLASLALLGGLLIGLKDLRLRRFESAALILLPGIVSHGIGLTLTKVLVDRVGALSAIVWFETLMLLYLVGFAWLNRDRLQGPLKENGIAALAYFVGFLAFATALSSGFVSLVAPVANLFPLVVVGLAVLVYGEKLQRHQWAGLALAVSALVGLAL